MDMFKKLKCKGCDEKVSKKYSYCPHCGDSLRGENSEKFFEQEINSLDLGLPFGLNKIFESMLPIDSKMIKELNNLKINIKPQNGRYIIEIEGKNSLNEQPNFADIQDKECKNPNHHHHEHHQKVPTKIDEARTEKFSGLPREEPNTRVRRLTNKLVYEINLPGVKNNDIIISKLENSIEVKAFSEDKAFFKLIPHSLPIIGSELKEGILNLELKL